MASSGASLLQTVPITKHGNANPPSRAGCPMSLSFGDLGCRDHQSVPIQIPPPPQVARRALSGPQVSTLRPGNATKHLPTTLQIHESRNPPTTSDQALSSSAPSLPNGTGGKATNPLKPRVPRDRRESAGWSGGRAIARPHPRRPPRLLNLRCDFTSTVVNPQPVSCFCNSHILQ